ncbi:MAG: hypothetical protein WCK98_02090 [bacterium]
MTTTITITEFLRNPKRVRKMTEEGLTIIVLINNEPVFEIKAFTPKPKKRKTLTSFSFDIPDKLSKKDIYEKYGAR